MRCRTFAGCLFVSLLCLSAARAEAPRVLPEGKLPDDKRLGELTTLNGYFPFQPRSPEAWKQRSERVRRQLLVALGLWPMPTKTPSRPVVHGKIEQDDYTIEKVYLQSMPGHYVTGNLYRPKGKSGKLPGVLCPHGHWSNGRFYDNEKRMKDELEKGSEKYEQGGRSPLQARCVQLARMGCVVFHWDMIGYADSQQVSYQVAHRYSKKRPEMETDENWGFYSPQAEANLQTVMGLQSFNSIRVLDWFSTLDDVDPQRIAVTGASGGGTQTFILSAIDPRVAVSFPAVMVSTAMQGGCTCENCSYLRIDTGNIEFAALFAPKPLAMTAANDWTKEIMTKGYPELKEQYKRLGKPNHVQATAYLQFGHNYNYPSRAVMYAWMNEHLKLGVSAEKLVEQDYAFLTEKKLTVYDDAHPRPAGGDDHERAVLKWWNRDNRKQIDGLPLSKYREVLGGAYEVLLGGPLPAKGAVTGEKVNETPRDKYIEYTYLLSNAVHGSQLPTLFLFPKDWNREVVIWVDGQGKAGLFGANGSPKPEVMKLLEAGYSVAAADLLYQGEFLTDGKPLADARQVKGNRDYAGYTYGYNYPIFAQRVRDLLSLISYCQHHEDKPEHLHLLGLGAGGRLAAAARTQAGEAITRAAIDTDGFRFAKLDRYTDPDFLNGAVKYGDLPGMLAVTAPAETWLAGEKQVPKTVLAAYRVLSAGRKLTGYDGDDAGKAEAAVEWLMR